MSPHLGNVAPTCITAYDLTEHHTQFLLVKKGSNEVWGAYFFEAKTGSSGCLRLEPPWARNVRKLSDKVSLPSVLFRERQAATPFSPALEPRSAESAESETTVTTRFTPRSTLPSAE